MQYINPQDEALTDEQLEEHKQKAKAYYEKNLPLLRLQVEYEESLARVEEARLRREMAVSRFIQMQAQAQAAQNPEQNKEKKTGEKTGPVERILKHD